MRRRIQINIRPLSIGLGLALGIAIGYLATHGWPVLAHAFTGLWGTP